MRLPRPSTLLLLIAAALLVSLTPRPAQDAAFDPAAMAEMLTLAQPGPEHAQLARYVGAWKGEVSLWSPFMPAGSEPLKQEASATCRTILGGRFLEMTAHGDFMGQPFESGSMMGFDRRNKEWTTVGFDTLGTYWVSGAGTRDDDGIIRMQGRDDSPQGQQLYVFELEFVSDDEFVSSVVFVKQGPKVYDPPFKMVEARYTRK